MEPKPSGDLAGGPLPANGTFTAVGSMTGGRFLHTATLLGNGNVLIAGGYPAPANTGELFDSASGTFTRIPNLMTSRRFLHTATLLPSGKVLIAGGYAGSTALNTADLFDPASGTFTLVPNTMTLARVSHSATLLPSGKVLLAGGKKGSNATNTAELFDPATETFTSLAPMAAARQNHTATLLPSGKVLIVGGYAGSVTMNTVELFDPDTGTFTLVPNTMTSARDSHSATLLPSGKVLVAGGFTGTVTTNTAELFDPTTGTFMLLPPMTEPRYYCTATLLPSGKVLIAGGFDGQQTTKTAELFDPALGTFTSLLPNTMTSARDEYTATLLPSGKILLAGGKYSASGVTSTAELFDSVSGSFTATSSLNLARFFPTATLLASGKVLIAGGQSGTGPTTTAELFDPASGTFAILPNNMNAARFRHTATLLRGGKVLLAGGDTSSVGTGATSTAELFDPVSETFRLLPLMTSPRLSHTATLLSNGKVLLTGGIATADFQLTNSAELFDPVTETFTSVSPMSSKRDFHTATLLANGKVLVAGGFDPMIGGLNTAEVFDSASGTFTLLSNPMTTKRYYHSATLLPNGKVFMAGGGGSAPPVLSGAVITNTAELFDPTSGTFTQVSNTMNSYRYWQTTTLLPSGKVLIAGGSTVDYAGAEYTPTAELFDPVIQTFTLLPLMNSVRFGHTATLLPSGRVLIAAGTTGSTATNTAELFDEGLGFSDARRPVLATAPNSLVQPASLVLTGTAFRGDSEASGSASNNSATNYPILQLMRIDNEQSFFVLSDLATNWSDTVFSSQTLNALPSGQYRVTIFTNAIPSLSKIISIGGPPLQLVSAVSRKTHGSAGNFDVDLPFSFNIPVPPPGVECRSGGANGDYTLVFTFNNTPVSGNASLTNGTGSVSGSPTFAGHTMSVNFIGVTNAQVIGVILNVTDDFGQFFANPEGIPVNMGVLAGDTNADGTVNSADISQTKSQSGQPVTSSNFREDVTVDGSLNSADIALVKSKSGTALP